MQKPKFGVNKLTRRTLVGMVSKPIEIYFYRPGLDTIPTSVRLVSLFTLERQDRSGIQQNRHTRAKSTQLFHSLFYREKIFSYTLHKGIS